MLRKSTKFAHELVELYYKDAGNGYYFAYEDLDERDRQRLASLLFEEHDGLEIEYCIGENKNYNDIMSSFISMLWCDDQDHDKDFVTSMKENVVAYYETQMRKILDEAFDIFLAYRTAGIDEQDDYFENKKRLYLVGGNK